MAALNKDETESLSFAGRAMNDSANRMARAAEGKCGSEVVSMTASEMDFMIASLKKAERLVNAVKQMKGYYPN